jgi:hypothetical protein
MTRATGAGLFVFGLGLVLGVFSALPARGAVTKKSCLPQRQGDLAQILKSQSLARAGAAQKAVMVPVTRGSPRWMAAFNAVLAWENDDCEAFSAFAEKMGYEAVELHDSPTGARSWLVAEKDGGRHNGLFVLRAPDEARRARRLILTAPLLGADFGDGRAARLYQQLSATALLMNTAERCSLNTCSGCAAVKSYACGGCSRASDAAHSVDNLLFALFAALEATRTHNGARPWLHFEYQAVAPPSRIDPSCAGLGQLTPGPGRGEPLLPIEGEATSYPRRFYEALRKRLGDKCVCYHQRERGCSLQETQSVLGRLVNQESPGPFDPCTQEATRLSGRHLHFEWVNIPLETVAAALAEAVPQ